MSKPIIYSYSVPTRFSDLDAYNHVNFKYYLDYVINSRLYFLKEKFNIGLHELAKLGVGFYATHLDVSYNRPIRGLTFVEVESYLAEVIDEVVLKVPFKIYDRPTEKIYCQGTFTFSVVDTQSGKPKPMTEEVRKLFFEEK
jgi:acyl-CoA thioesterase FadM